jgi:pimeloyl-ACP methyl ester carboxylesterase
MVSPTVNRPPPAASRHFGEDFMSHRTNLAAAFLAAALSLSTVAAAADPKLEIAKQGYVFAGGHYDSAHPGNHLIGQLYAEYQIPARQTHKFPIVMIHGGSQSGTNFTGTPDGREGWAQYFLRQGYAVYVVDQPGRGRAAYHADAYGPAAALSIDFVLQRFAAPERFNLWPQAHLHGQWPGKPEQGDPVFDQFYASQLPSIADFAEQQELNRDAGAALLDKIGPAVLLTHSQSGAFGWPIAQARPNLVKAIVAVEPSGPPVHDIAFSGTPNYFADVPKTKISGLGDIPLAYAPPVSDQSPLEFVQQDKPAAPDLVKCWLQKEPARKLVALDRIPLLIIQSEASYHASYDHCTVAYLAQAGVRSTYVRLADRGIHGNGHMMMLEKNNAAIAKVMADWLGKTLQPVDGVKTAAH